jgi:hypothetical protein
MYCRRFISKCTSQLSRAMPESKSPYRCCDCSVRHLLCSWWCLFSLVEGTFRWALYWNYIIPISPIFHRTCSPAIRHDMSILNYTAIWQLPGKALPMRTPVNIRIPLRALCSPARPGPAQLRNALSNEKPAIHIYFIFYIWRWHKNVI